MGSGSTLIAALLNNRKGVGFDIDLDYCKLAYKRLQQEADLKQENLFIERKDNYVQVSK